MTVMNDDDDDDNADDDDDADDDYHVLTITGSTSCLLGSVTNANPLMWQRPLGSKMKITIFVNQQVSFQVCSCQHHS